MILGDIINKNMLNDHKLIVAHFNINIQLVKNSQFQI